MFVFAIAVYLSITIPTLKAVVEPTKADQEFIIDAAFFVEHFGSGIIEYVYLAFLHVRKMPPDCLSVHYHLNPLNITSS